VAFTVISVVCRDFRLSAILPPNCLWVYLYSNFSGALRKIFFSASVRPFKVIQGHGANRKRVCDFLLVRHSNRGPSLHPFRDIAGFLCSWPHPYSTLILGCSRWTRSPTSGSARASTLS